MLRHMGILDAAVYGLTERLKERGLPVIAPVVMVAITLNVTFTGMRELDVIFITLMIPICLCIRLWGIGPSVWCLCWSQVCCTC